MRVTEALAARAPMVISTSATSHPAWFFASYVMMMAGVPVLPKGKALGGEGNW